MTVLGYAHISMIKPFSQGQFSVYVSFQWELCWLSFYMWAGLEGQNTALQSPPSLQQIAFFDKNGKPRVQFNTEALLSCRLSHLSFSVVKPAALGAFSQLLLKNLLLQRAGWGLLSDTSIILTVHPLSFRDTGLWKFHSGLSELWSPILSSPGKVSTSLSCKETKWKLSNQTGETHEF